MYDWDDTTVRTIAEVVFTGGTTVVVRKGSTANELELVGAGTDSYTIPDHDGVYHLALKLEYTGDVSLSVNGVVDCTTTFTHGTLSAIRLGDVVGTSFAGLYGHLKAWGSRRAMLTDDEIAVLANPNLADSEPASVHTDYKGDILKVRVVDSATNLLVAELDPVEAEVSRAQDDAGSWSFTVPIFMPYANAL